ARRLENRERLSGGGAEPLSLCQLLERRGLGIPPVRPIPDGEARQRGAVGLLVVLRAARIDPCHQRIPLPDWMYSPRPGRTEIDPGSGAVSDAVRVPSSRMPKRRKS